MTLSYLDFMEGLAARGYPALLTPAQRAFARTAFDGEAPDDSPESIALWGDWRDLPTAAARKTAAAVCGRGSGKSLLGGSRLLHLAMTVDVSGLQPRERALCPIVAPSLEQAKISVRFALGAAETLGLAITQGKADGEEGFSITRANGPGGRPIKVRIAPIAASGRGKVGRGYAIPGAVLDEVAFFFDASYKVNDKDVYDSLKFRIMPGGQLILLSSPWLENGLLYEFWVRNYNHPEDALVAHAPTSLMRANDPDIMAAIELERSVDPEGTRRERDAVFQTANAKAFFDPRAVSAALNKPVTLTKNATHSCGGDFAFSRNSTAFAAVQCRFDEGVKVYELTDLEEHRPGKTPLKVSATCESAALFAARNHTDAIVADGHYREAVTEHLLNDGVTFVIAPQNATGVAEVFQAARKLLHEGVVRLPPEIGGDKLVVDKLVRQLREVTMRKLAGGGVKIDSPLWRSGEHGDLVAALVLALWRAERLGHEETAPKREGYGAPDELEEKFMADEARKRERLERLERATGMNLLDRRPGERPLSLGNGKRLRAPLP